MQSSWADDSSEDEEPNQWSGWGAGGKGGNKGNNDPQPPDHAQDADVASEAFPSLEEVKEAVPQQNEQQGGGRRGGGGWGESAPTSLEDQQARQQGGGRGGAMERLGGGGGGGFGDRRGGGDRDFDRRGGGGGDRDFDRRGGGDRGFGGGFNDRRGGGDDFDRRGGGFEDREGRDGPREETPFPDEPPFTAYIGNLNFQTPSLQLKEYLEYELGVKPEDGVVKDVRIIERDGQSKGYGYAEFVDREALEFIVTAGRNGDLNLDDRRLKADVSAQREGRERSRADEAGKWRREGGSGSGTGLPPMERLTFDRRDRGDGFGDRRGGFDRRGPPRERPKLNLNPPPAERQTAPEDAPRPSSIFGDAKPADTAAAERKAMERRAQREAEERAKREAARAAREAGSGSGSGDGGDGGENGERSETGGRRGFGDRGGRRGGRNNDRRNDRFGDRSWGPREGEGEEDRPRGGFRGRDRGDRGGARNGPRGERKPAPAKGQGGDSGDAAPEKKADDKPVASANAFAALEGGDE